MRMSKDASTSPIKNDKDVRNNEKEESELRTIGIDNMNKELNYRLP